uniref:Uncharacterized protein n=1 Tax=Heliothis virescens TaxID=7102 RepID=A0A2A4JAW5_HELVI
MHLARALLSPALVRAPRGTCPSRWRTDTFCAIDNEADKVEHGCADDESEHTRRRKWCLRNPMGARGGGAGEPAAARGGSTGLAGGCGLRQPAARPRWQRGRVFQAGPRAAPTALRNRRLCKACRCQLAAARVPPEGKVERGAVVRARAPPLHAPRTPVKCLPVSCQCRF